MSGSELASSFETLFDPADVRGTWSISGDTEGEASGLKFPTTIGAEDFHVIRLAEVLLITQDEVLAAIDLERQFELAFEGDRWPDLVRTGRAAGVLGIPEYQTLYPVPQTEIDVAPGIAQNPGY